MLKAFKYFDLDNSGFVDKEEFIKVIDKIGVQIANKEDLLELFNIYDADKNG